MDIAGAFLDGVDQGQVHQLDDRRLIRLFLQISHRDIGALGSDFHVSLFIFDAAQGVVERGGLVIEMVHGPFEGFFGGDVDIDGITGQKFEVVHGEDIGGIGHGHLQHGAGPFKGDGVIFLDDVDRDELHDLGIRRDFLEYDRGEPVLISQKIDQLLFSQVPQLHEL